MKEDYRTAYKSLPYIPRGARPGGAVAALGARISQAIARDEASLGQAYATTPSC